MGIKNDELKKQIALLPATKDRTDFYQYLFTNNPDLRKYFAGHENQDPKTVSTDPYWQTQSVILWRKMVRLVQNCDDESKFNPSVEVMIISHYRRGIEAPIWHAFAGILAGFLKSKGVEPAPEWAQFAAAIAAIADKIAANGYALS